MENTKLVLKEIPSVPKLKSALGASSHGHKLLVFSSDKDSFHIALAEGSLESFGGITVVSPGVSERGIDTTLWLDRWLQVKGLQFGAGGWGQVGSSCKLSVTFYASAGIKEINSVNAKWVCTPVPE
jgi:hypothetical protein